MKSDQPVFFSSNRGFRYGDGLFETMKIVHGQIHLDKLHFERLFHGLKLLKFQLPDLFTPEYLRENALLLCQKNNCAALGRIRLTVFRGNGGLHEIDLPAEFIIECWPLDKTSTSFNENGIHIDFFTDVRKSCDLFANLKSASHLPYVLAAAFAKEKKLEDCTVLNSFGRVADTSIANIFLIKEDTIYTPSLAEGCIAGVMRAHLILLLKQKGMRVQETTITVNDILETDELFITNAIRGIKWVGRCCEKNYTNHKLKMIIQDLNYSSL